MTYKIILITTLFIIVTYFVLNYTSADFKEALTMGSNNSESNCPNILIQQGSQLYLYNSKKHTVPGVNPVIFNNLEEKKNQLRILFITTKYIIKPIFIGVDSLENITCNQVQNSMKETIQNRDTCPSLMHLSSTSYDVHEQIIRLSV
jgi:hypothetical protein